MKMRVTTLVTLCSLLLLATVAFAAGPNAFNNKPNQPTSFGFELVITEYDHWAHVTQRDWIAIRGCGFKSYSHVVCMWDYRWMSFTAHIATDDLILCQVPLLSHSDFGSLPYWTRMDLIFDGNLREQDTYAQVPATIPGFTVAAGPFRFGPALDCEAPLNPTHGVINGGTSVQISGEGFQDNMDITVYFDGASASGTATSDNIITVSSPAGEFNQYAMVTVVLNNDPNCYMHAKDTFHYGPLPEFILPPCTHKYGGTDLWIHGLHMGDSGAQGNPGPIFVEVYDPSDSNPELSESRVGVLATTASALESLGAGRETALRFTAPNPSQFDFDGGNPVHFSPSLKVHWRQVDANSLDLDFSYFYGPLVFGENSANPGTFINPWQTGDEHTNPVIDAEADGSCGNPNDGLVWPNIPGAHYGGEDEVCVRGCGFTNYTGNQIDFLELNLDGSAWCDTGKVVRYTSGGSVNSPTEEEFCCTVALSQCSNEAIQTLEVVYTDSFDTPTDGPDPALNVIVGPQVDRNQRHRGPRAAGYDYVFTGTFFRFARDTRPDAWSPSLLVTITDVDDDDSSITFADEPFTISSDCLANWIVPQGEFSLDAELTFDFGDQGACQDLPPSNPPLHHWGPECSIPSLTGPLSGNAQFTFSGEGFLESGYEPENVRVHMCAQRFSDNTATDPCMVHEDVSASLSFSPGVTRNGGDTTSDSVTATTLDLYADTVTPQGGQRLWGDDFEVWIFFPDNITNLPDTDTGVRIERSYLHCADYRFGPVVNTITPCKGPIGYETTEVLPITSVSLGGTDMADNWDGNEGGPISRDINPHRVTFGSVFGTNPTISSASLGTNTLWGGVAKSDVSVTTWFDTCNTTAESDVTIHWGPVVSHVEYNDPSVDLLPENVKGTADIYGFKPWADEDGSAETISIFGQGFEAYCSDKWNNEPCTDGSYESYARCIIDGVKVVATIAPFNNGTFDTYIITCDPPRRPFGSRAAVSVEFGRPCTSKAGATNAPGVDIRADKDDLVKFTPESDWTEREVDWTRTLTASNAIWYRPLIVSISPTTGITSGNTPVTITGEGFDGWDVFGDPEDYECYFGHFESEGGDCMVVDNTQITTTTPIYQAEFNTFVTVSVTVPGFNETTDMFPNKFVCNEDIHDWKVWLEDAYHYGPTCNGVSVPYGSHGGFRWSGDEYDLLAVDHVDCLECNTEGCSSSLWENPQIQPFPAGDVTPQFRGSWNCIHRKVQYFRQFYDYYDTSAPQITEEGPFDPVSNDTQFQNGASIPIEPRIVRDGNVPCPARTTFTLYFPDALVSTEAQRRVDCFDFSQSLTNGVVILGPIWNARLDAEWHDDDDSTFSGVSYGWVGDFVQLQFINLGDPWVNCGSCGDGTEISFLFHTNIANLGANVGNEGPAGCFTNQGLTQDCETSDFNGQYSTAGILDSVYTGAPDVGTNANMWDTYRRMRLIYRQQSNANNGTDCDVEADLFHYGPVLTQATYNGNDAADSCSPLRVIENDNEEIVIHGRAFLCCGFIFDDSNPGDSSGGVNAEASNSPSCRMPNHFDSLTYNNNTLNSNDGGGGNAIDSVTCVMPFNNYFNSPSDVNQAIYGIGLRWNNSANFELLATEDGEILSHCYGPRQAPQAETWRYSSLLAGLSDEPNHSVTNRERVSIAAVGGGTTNLDDNNGIFEGEPICRWLGLGNGGPSGSDYLIDTEGGTYDCPAHRVFWKRCGDGPEQVSLIWNFTNGDGDQYVELEVTVPTSASSPAWQQQSGPDVVQTISYGPVLESVRRQITPYDPTQAPQSTYPYGHLTIYTWEEGGLMLEADISNQHDWLGNDVNGGDWGTEVMLPIFGNRRGGPVLQSNKFPGLVDGDFVPFSNEDYTGSTIDIPDSGTTDPFRVPPNGFNVDQRVSFLLDPHADELTNLFSESERDRFTYSRVTDYWHWVPYANNINRRSSDAAWGSSLGYEAIVVRGGGFCEYSSVHCIFDGTADGHSVQGEGNIAADNLIICRTPPSSPRSTAVRLRFCDVNQRCDCGLGCDSSHDTTTVWDQTPGSQLSFEYYGISENTVPQEGPWYGATTVEYPYIGLQHFDRITCSFGDVDAPSDASFAGQSSNSSSNTGSLTCETPNVGGVSVLPVLMHLFWTPFPPSISYSPFASSPIWETVAAPNAFDFGEPTITLITPIQTDIDLAGLSTVVVEGRYFNGGPDLENGNYLCLWYNQNRSLIATLSAVGKEPAVRNGIETFNLVCPTPEVDVDIMEIGLYQLEIQWDSAASPTRDYHDFRFSQNPLITNYTIIEEEDDDDEERREISECGDIVEIVGSNFNNFIPGRLLSLWESLEGDDPDVLSNCEYIDSEHLRCLAPFRNLTLQLSPLRNVDVSITLDGGETYSPAFTIEYEANPECIECFSAGSVLQFSVATLVAALIALVALF